MNERIKQLAEQANGPNPFYGTLKNQMTLLGDDAVEKFAELIIKECTDICAEQVTEYKKDIKSAWDQEEKEIFYEGMAAADRIRYKINRMFGVK